MLKSLLVLLSKMNQWTGQLVAWYEGILADVHPLDVEAKANGTASKKLLNQIKDYAAQAKATGNKGTARTRWAHLAHTCGGSSS